MPRERKIPARLRDSATSEDIEAAEGESSGSAPESPHPKLARKGSTSSSSDLASPVDRMNTNTAMGPVIQPMTSTMPAQYGYNHGISHTTETSDYASGASSEPVYPCGLCQKEVNDDDDAILCETGCSRWYHRLCTGLTVMAYNLLTTEHTAEWVCNTCIETKNIPLVKLIS